jgi:hypothetical protein
VDVEAGALGQPGTNFGVLVGAVVVDDQVDVEILRDGLLDLAEEAAVNGSWREPGAAELRRR